MAGQRASKHTPIPFAPGVISNLTDRDATNRYKDSNRVRWHKGLAEKVGGWVRQTLIGANNGVYIGVARALQDWASIDTQQWIAIGTHCKLYLCNNSTLSDITPLRKASNTTASLSVTAGSAAITINDPDHRARTGDHIRLYTTAPIGGFTVDGVYDIASIPTPDSIVITFTSNFNATEIGGGSVTVEYDVTCGLPENGELRGYGTGLYGDGTYGTPRPVGSGVPQRMRTWSLDNWGEDLLAVPSDGELYWWDRTTGPNSRSVLVADAPTGIQRMLVNAKVGHVVLLGCSNLDGTPDPMRFRWCAQGDFNIWDPTLSKTAGGGRFDKGSRLITGIASRGTNYVWSDTFMYSLQYVGSPDIFLPGDLGSCKIVGPNAAIDVNGVVFFMAFDDFFIYDGTLRIVICEIHTKIFGDENRNIEGLFDRTQAEGVYAVSYQAKSEVTWFYPCTDGLIRYATYNYVLDCWYPGTMERTAYHDVSEAITGYKTNPYGVNGGYLYKHEIGTDEVEGATTTPQAWFLETYDINAGGSDAVMLWNFIVPNFDRLSGSMRLLLKKKAKPRQPTYQVRGPYTIGESTLELSVRCKASQIAMRFESAGNVGEDWRMGVFQVNATPYGGRVGAHIEDEVATSPEAPVLSGEVTMQDTDFFNSLTWTAGVAGSNPIAGYRLFDADNDGLLTDTTSLSFLRGPVELDIVYRYYVVAYDTEGLVSSHSNIVSLIASLTAPGPVVLTGMLNDGDPEIFWTESTPGSFPISSYLIYRSVNGGAFSLLDSVDSDVTSYYDTSATAPNEYAYYVVAVDSADAESPDSNVLSFDTASEDVVVLLTADTGELVEWSGLPDVTVQGGGVISTSQIKFGTASFYNPGTNAQSVNYVRLEDSFDSQGLFVFAGQFTIEGWFYIQAMNTDQYNNLLANSINFPTTGFIQLAVRNLATDHMFWNSGPGGGAEGGILMPTGQWVFVAVTRDASDVFRMFQDGVKIFEGTKSGTIGVLNPTKSSLDVCRGHAGDNADANCFFDQIRMTKRCRYTTDFTPPTAPFPKF